TFAAAFTHDVDELLMNFIQHILCELLMPLIRWREWIQNRLVFASRQQTALHPQLFHCPGKSETIHQHSDRTDDTGLVDINLICRCSYVITTRSANISDYGINRHFRMQGAQALDLIVDNSRLYRTTPGTVDPQNQPFGPFVLESRL